VSQRAIVKNTAQKNKKQQEKRTTNTLKEIYYNHLLFIQIFLFISFFSVFFLFFLFPSFSQMSRDLDVSDPALAQAWKEVTDQKSQDNWVLFEIQQGSPPKLVVAGQGSGGYEELRSKFDQTKIQFGGLRVIGKDNRETLEALRNKYVFFTFIGDKVSVLQRAKVSVQRSYAEKIFNGYAIRLDISGGDLDTAFSKNTIGKELLRCGGAHKPSHYVFGPNDEILVNDLS